MNVLGKASEIKTAVLSDWTDTIQAKVNTWIYSYWEVQIIDIQFNSVFCPDDNHHWSHVLIIYKEASES
jgi:hypothetical protein